MGRTACIEPQCLYKGALHFFFLVLIAQETVKKFGMNRHLSDIAAIT
jgi:hypothetical protein